MNLHNLINQAIINNQIIRVSYRDYHGNVTNRDISPLEWDGSTNKFRAYCYLRQEERHFRVANILTCELVNRTPTTLSVSMPHSEQNHILEHQAPYMEIKSISQAGRSNKKVTSSNTASIPPFSKVNNAVHWSRLIQYFRKCLIHENYQQYIITNQPNDRLFWADEGVDIQQIMAGVIQVTFQVSASRPQPPVINFISEVTKRKNQQLCLGYPLYIVSPDEIAPLIFSPLTIEIVDNVIKLQAEDLEVSYAALKSLKLDDEEIEQVLAECAEVRPQPQQSIVLTLADFLVGKLSEIISRPLSPHSWDGKSSPGFQTGQIYAVPCLFWVSSNIATANLIDELSQLSNEAKWNGLPSALKEIFGRCSEREYPDVPPFEHDTNIYVSAINEQQRRAIRAMQAGDVSVITGPPGTGKSQLVLNMVAQAILNGQTVLFASRNNKAVDVVMDRLHEDLRFPGAVRTGKKEYRRRAAETMDSTLNLISTVRVTEPVSTLRETYFEHKGVIKETEAMLHRVRELRGLIESHQVEYDTLVKRLPPKLIPVVESNLPRCEPHEVDHFLAMLSTLTTTTLKAKHRKADLEAITIDVIRGSGKALYEVLVQFEDQWGSFGGGFLHPDQFESLEKLEDYVRLWLVFLSTSGIQSQITQLNQSYRELHQYRLRSFETLPTSLQTYVKEVASTFSAAQLKASLQQAKKLTQYAKAVSQNKISLLDKILIWLGVKDPLKQIKSDLLALRQSVKLANTNETSQRSPNFMQLTDDCVEMTLFLEMSLLQRRITDNRKAHKHEEKKLNEVAIQLPEAIREDVRKLDIPAMNLDTFQRNLTTVLNDIQSLINHRGQLAERVNAKIEANDDKLKMLAEFKETTGDKNKRLWFLRNLASLLVIEYHLIKWRNIVSLWKVKVKLQNLEQEALTLPTEKLLLEKLGGLEKEQLAVGARIVRRQWLENVRALDANTIQGVHYYVSAIRQLQEYNSANYSNLKATEEANLVNAIKVFPVWATTNLSAKSNLALTAGLFDIVIIDEASQCDIPSALPLLYRAKQVVIIGDPNQLKHVATLSYETDQEAAIQFGVDTSAFHYNTHSLFDIAARSVALRPGKITLREHYRSHPQIIGFSNEEFYDGELIVKTDLERRGIPEDFLKKAGGIFWIHVNGVAERPLNGSAINLPELDAVKSLIPCLVERLQQYDMPTAEIGIVTPYREQARLFERWNGDNDKVLVGTAHTFQGNERDIMVFSPVLAPGLSEGSLNWLDRTVNLLNVAVTRARSTLIIIGNWDYCQTLSLNSKYRRLIDYIARQPYQPMRRIDDLPLFSGIPFDVIGTLLDPAQPQYNRVTLRRLVSSAREFVWWIDPYFNSHVFEFFLDIFQDANSPIQSIRLLTAIQQIEPSKNGRAALDPEEAKVLSHELKLRGISFELRLLPKNKLPHDRHFYSKGQSINMPPFGGAYGDHKHISEYTRSKTEPSFFEEFWQQATGLQYQEALPEK